MFHTDCPNCQDVGKVTLAPCDVAYVTVHPDAVVLLVAGACEKCWHFFSIEYDLHTRQGFVTSVKRLSRDEIIELKAIRNRKGNDDAKSNN